MERKGLKAAKKCPKLVLSHWLHRWKNPKNDAFQREIHIHENVRVYSRKTFFILNGNLIFSNSEEWSRNILSTYHTRVNLYHTFS